LILTINAQGGHGHMKLPWKLPLRFAGATLLVFLLLSSGAFGTTSGSTIVDLEIRPVDDEVELTVDGSIEYGYFPLNNPKRLVFDFPGAILDYNDGTMVSEIVPGTHFSEVKISQYSIDPPITRLVFHVNDGVDAVVNFDPNTGKLVIRLSDQLYESGLYTSDGRISNLIVEEAGAVLDSGSTVPAVEEIEVLDVSTVTSHDPADLSSVYEVISSETETLIRFPGILPENIRVTQNRFPDRLSVRLFTAGDFDGERPRFDLLERGNIWNNSAKQWTSYFDRDGRGIVELIIYLYRDICFNQIIDATGTPVVTLNPIGPEPIPPPVIEPEIIINELEVSGYEAEEISGEELFIAGESLETEEIIEPEVQLVAEVVVEPEVIIEDEPVLVTEPVIIIEESDSPLGPEVGNPNPSGMIAGTRLNGTTDITKLPIVLTQADLLAGSNVMGEPQPLFMRNGEVFLLKVPSLIRASVGNPAIATLNVISLDEVLITALSSGNTTLLVWSADHGYISRMITVVEANMAFEQQISSIINDENINVSVLTAGGSGGPPGVILEGLVETTEERARAESIAALFAGESMVSNLIEVTQPRQVLVKVRMVEVNKRALDENLSHLSAGARADNDDFTFNIITDLLDPANPGGGLFDNRVRPGVVNGNVEDIIFDPIDIVLNELETNRQANILSEPNLVAMSGEQAFFRVGGEVPYTYLNQDGVMVVEFKEFGISLEMTPTVDSQDNIRLEIKPIVRTVDMALAISGIPGFRTREMETSVQLRPGETLVIGGLIQNEITEIISKVPILGDIPILGELFRSKSFNEDETELVIFLSPYLIDKPYESEIIADIDPELALINHVEEVEEEEEE